MPSKDALTLLVLSYPHPHPHCQGPHSGVPQQRTSGDTARRKSMEGNGPSHGPSCCRLFSPHELRMKREDLAIHFMQVNRPGEQSTSHPAAHSEQPEWSPHLHLPPLSLLGETKPPKGRASSPCEQLYVSQSGLKDGQSTTRPICN